MAQNTPKRPAPPTPDEDPEKLKVYFNRVDKNGNGSISAEELRDALTNGKEEHPFNLATIQAMMETFNSGNQNEVKSEKRVMVCWKI
jgi:Ca2+-binding EF-hand superfamily protein